MSMEKGEYALYDEIRVCLPGNMYRERGGGKTRREGYYVKRNNPEREAVDRRDYEAAQGKDELGMSEK